MNLECKDNNTRIFPTQRENGNLSVYFETIYTITDGNIATHTQLWDDALFKICSENLLKQ